MARIIVAPSANADISTIENDLAKYARKPLAEKYSAGFRNLFNRLAEYTDSCARRRGFGEGYPHRNCVPLPRHLSAS
jgi:hypothetical protein